MGQPEKLHELMAAIVWEHAPSSVNSHFAKVSLPYYMNATVHFNAYYARNKQDWYMFKLGPFVHTGQSTHTVQAVLKLPYLNCDQRSQLCSVSEFILGSIDESNGLIGYPPLHQHHYHLSSGSCMYDEDMSTHGESQCQASEGGVACLWRRAPHGFAFYVETPGIFSRVDDVRSNGQPTMHSYVFAALKIAPTSNSARQISIAYAFPGGGSNSVAGYHVDVSAETLTWSTYQLPPHISIIHMVQVHSHDVMLNDLWLFQGVPEQVFSDLRAASQANSTARLTLMVGQNVISTMKDNIMRRQLRSGAAHLACSKKRSSADELIYFEGNWIPFPRTSRCDLDPSIRAWVALAFHKLNTRQAALQQSPLKSPMFVHALFWIYYSRNNPRVLVQRADKVFGECNSTFI